MPEPVIVDSSEDMASAEGELVVYPKDGLQLNKWENVPTHWDVGHYLVT
jgi:hypothetical protein